MSIPVNFQDQIDQRGYSVMRWLEIEGLPYAYGNVTQSGSFFSGRSSLKKFLGIKPYLSDIPKNIDQTIDTLEGGALTVGQVDFPLVDVDDSLTALVGYANQDGVVVLAAEIDATDVDITVLGSVGSFVNGGYFYIGNETIKIGTISGNTFESCTRGMFRSKPRAFGIGVLISPRPYTMANRRCWYNQLAYGHTALAISVGGPAVAANPMAYFSSTLEPDTCVRFSGTLQNFIIKDGEVTTWIITAQSMERELDRNCFRGMRSFPLKGTSFMAADGTGGNITATGLPGYFIGAGGGSPNDSIYNWPSGLFTGSEPLLLRIQDEIFYAQVLNATTSPRMQVKNRGLLGTGVEKHDEGQNINEVIPVIAWVNSGSATRFEQASRFKSVPTDSVPLSPDHPLILVLQVLLSTGTGENNIFGERNYDVLPAEWGMGLDINRVDTFGIEAAAKEEPTLRFGGLVTEPLNFLDFLRQTLKIAGYYYLITLGDLFIIKRLRPPLPDVTTRPVTNDDRIRKNFTGWEANWSGAIREVIFAFGYDIVAGDYKYHTNFELTDGDIYSNGLARSVKFESRFLYRGGSGVRGEPPLRIFDVDQWLLNRADFYRVRYARPPPIVRERLNYSFIGVEVGDLLLVTHPQLPNIVSGVRGITENVAEVIGKSIDDKSKTINLTLLMTGYMLGDYRFFAPSLEVLSLDLPLGGAGLVVMTYKVNSFTEAYGPTNLGQVDSQIENSAGEGEAVFRLGDVVWLWSPDFYSKWQAVVSSINHVTQAIELDASLFSSADPDFGTPAEGWIITHEEWDNATDYLKATFGYGAQADGFYSDEASKANKYFPA